MTIDDKYALGLGVLSLVVLGVGTLVGRYFRNAPARIVRTVFPIVSVLTLAAFAVFVYVARDHVKG